MSCHASTAGWNSGHNAGGAGPNSGWSAGQRRCGPPRGLEIGGTGWPWNGAGNGARGPRGKFSSTGNFAFEEYRRRELERLEEERRRLDEEATAFAYFVEELKRAKDRDEFDAFMAKRRQGPATA